MSDIKLYQWQRSFNTVIGDVLGVYFLSRHSCISVRSRPVKDEIDMSKSRLECWSLTLSLDSRSLRVTFTFRLWLFSPTWMWQYSPRNRRHSPPPPRPLTHRLNAFCSIASTYFCSATPLALQLL